MNNNSNGANHITTQVPLNVMKYTISNGAKKIPGNCAKWHSYTGDKQSINRVWKILAKNISKISKVQESKSASVGPQYGVRGKWVSSDPFRVSKDVPLPYCCKVTAYRSNHIRWFTRWALIQQRQVLLGVLVPDWSVSRPKEIKHRWCDTVLKILILKENRQGYSHNPKYNWACKKEGQSVANVTSDTSQWTHAHSSLSCDFLRSSERHKWDPFYKVTCLVGCK